jgi:hypothetical protein
MGRKNRNESSLEAEKHFLHDLSSPVMIATGWCERWLKRDPKIKDTEEFRNLQIQLERLRELVTRRRDVLVKREQDDA